MRRLLFFFLPLVLAACQSADDEYSTHQCYFAFNCSYHPTSQLVSAVTSYDTYAIVTTSATTGRAYTVVSSLYGADTQYDNITTDAETQRSHILGLSNGLIIGKSIMDQTLYAFDRQCPNCFAETNLTAAPLQWGGGATMVKCNKCGRTYNLSSRGVVSDGAAGQSLLRYRITYDGTYIWVQNR